MFPLYPSLFCDRHDPDRPLLNSGSEEVGLQDRSATDALAAHRQSQGEVARKCPQSSAGITPHTQACQPIEDRFRPPRLAFPTSGSCRGRTPQAPSSSQGQWRYTRAVLSDPCATAVRAGGRRGRTPSRVARPIDARHRIRLGHLRAVVRGWHL